MKTNKPEHEMDLIDRVGLAAFGIVIGGVMTACFVFMLILGSTSELSTTTRDVKPEFQLAATPSATGATIPSDGQEAGRGLRNKSKSPPKDYRLRKNQPRKPSLSRTKEIAVYRTSVVPGKTPKMTEVQ